MEGPGTQSAEYQFVTGVREPSSLGKPGPLEGKESLEGGNVGALSQGTFQHPSLGGVASGGEAGQPEGEARSPQQVFHTSCSPLDTLRL